MRKIKRLLALFLLALITFSAAQALTVPADALPSPVLSVSAESAVLMLSDGKTVLYEKNADTRLPMASTTKIMTALTALELASPEMLITVDPLAVGTEGSSVYLVAGERLTLEQLLYALLLESANDAAVAIAVALAGSIEAFAREMNRQAKELGLADTHFENPHGLDHEEHYSTATELAKIATAALRHPILREIVGTRKTTIPHPDAESTRLLVNHNKLLRMYEGCIGVKTGYTQRSGRCLVSAARRNGVEMIAVTLNASDDWDDHTAMLDYGFSRYTARTLCTEGEVRHTLPLVGGEEPYVLLTNTETVTLPLPVSAGEIEMRIDCRPFEYAAVSAGSVCGIARFFCDTDGDGRTEEIAEAPLRACAGVEKKQRDGGILAWIRRLFSALLGGSAAKEISKISVK